MTAKTSKSKTKKVLETSLGRAPNPTEKVVDLSHIRKPIHTSVFGLKQILTLFETATDEVQNYITHECDVMYECRICRTIFRSLANFILHKRNYCREKYSCFIHSNCDNNDFHQSKGYVIDEEIKKLNGDEEGIEAVTLPSEITTIPKREKDTTKKSISPIIEKLIKKHEIKKLAEKALRQDLTITVESINASKNNQTCDGNEEKHDVVLEKIDATKSAVFQTVCNSKSNEPQELMKSEVMEIHGIFDSDEVVLGADGKVCSFETNKINNTKQNIPKKDLVCTECNIKFSTKKTLTYHIKYKHNGTRTVLLCPICKDPLANAWCVYRHLYKVHRRTSAQIKRMRDQIHANTIRRDQEPSKKKEKKFVTEQKPNEENQWLDNFETDNNLQRCGGCGKKFERKAALHSHSQMCTKRIAVCNTIKENNSKLKAIDEKTNNKNKNNINNKVLVLDKLKSTEIVKGAAKRKPFPLRVNKIKDMTVVNAKQLMSNKELGENKAENAAAASDNNFETESNSILDSLDTASVFNIIGISAKDYKLPKSIRSSENCKKISGNKTLENTTTKNNNELLLNGNFSEFPSGNNNTKETDPLEESFELETTSNKSENDINNDVILIKDIINTTQENQESIVIDDDSNSSTNINSDYVIDLSNESCEFNNELLQQQKTENNEIKQLNDRTLGDDESNDECSFKDVEIQNDNSDEFDLIIKKSLKRKRIMSCNTHNISKYVEENQENGELDQEEEVNFLLRASPYMDQEKLMCISCQITYASRYQLLWHMSLHFSWFRFQCSRCSFMSFNKYECVTHAHMHHNIPNHLMESTVLPIANWKTVLMSHEFRLLHSKEFDKTDGKKIKKEPNQLIEKQIKNNVVVNNNSSSGDYQFHSFRKLGNKTITSSAQTLKAKSYFNSKNILNPVNTEEGSSNSFVMKLPEQVYVINDSEPNSFDDEITNTNLPKFDEMQTDPLQLEDKDLLCENEKCFEDTNNTAIQEDNNEVIKEKMLMKKHSKTTKTSSIVVTNNLRPTRIRTKSIKTIQNDFIYDLNKVIKLDKNCGGSNKSKKGGHQCLSTSTNSKAVRDEIRRK